LFRSGFRRRRVAVEQAPELVFQHEGHDGRATVGKGDPLGRASPSTAGEALPQLRPVRRMEERGIVTRAPHRLPLAKAGSFDTRDRYRASRRGFVRVTVRIDISLVLVGPDYWSNAGHRESSSELLHRPGAWPWGGTRRSLPERALRPSHFPHVAAVLILSSRYRVVPRSSGLPAFANGLGALPDRAHALADWGGVPSMLAQISPGGRGSRAASATRTVAATRCTALSIGGFPTRVELDRSGLALAKPPRVEATFHDAAKTAGDPLSVDAPQTMNHALADSDCCSTFARISDSGWRSSAA